jgi:hypothetical protein
VALARAHGFVFVLRWRDCRGSFGLHCRGRTVDSAASDGRCVRGS